MVRRCWIIDLDGGGGEGGGPGPLGCGLDTDAQFGNPKRVVEVDFADLGVGNEDASFPQGPSPRETEV